ncbi:hypothetical protein HX017_02505 [Myroides marinus]|uniref:Lipoprotein n=1 Tax=Myroides marinus TaxID=703342 RepID=A0A161SC15_9FLAO|nr:hypothetical protein [Myroides marinus]KZE83565.1 hypothetical protein AV926_04610 [Myroides marinus]MDM1349471.1 hypothetical protein [Myroides marinus]MDM1356681.1 hypothetical protein [Myroides marinus]MDM1363823.1 hypothetical protein [Myroides marinus]MDM1379223.1 hypothetical protein [Myroides marinus]
MKNISLVIMVLVMIFVVGCSKEDLPENSRDISVQYTGNSVENRERKEYTHFYFKVKSKVNTVMQGYVEATTINNEKVTTSRFSLNIGETKEISIRRDGVLKKEYIKSYKVYAIPLNIDAFPKPAVPNRNFIGQPTTGFPMKWR